MQRNSLIFDVAKNFHTLRLDIALACKKVSRDPTQIHLVAVSKGHDFAVIRTLYHLGQRDFGENYAQEFAQKKHQALLENLSDIRWHFTGTLQSNKLKIIKDADVIHSLGNLLHAQKLSQMLTRTVDVFLQINLDENPKRSGFLKSELRSALKKILVLPHLKLLGLMAILPEEGSPKEWFSKMAAFKKSLLTEGLMSEVSLSMGMSLDFVEAIQYGAQFLRIGSRIFGPRS